jgi:acrylyl-CoA reductase (NADPH)
VQNEAFQALMVDQEDGQVQAALQDLTPESLPEGDVTIRVAYSSLNYKDGLAVTGQGKVIRNYPIVPGIDLVGVVEESQSPAFRPGDNVLVTGWGIGERHWGGYTQYTRVRSDWIVPLPNGLTPLQAMGLGTAGLTAMLCLMALEHNGLRPGEREFVVTGATGGVGSIAVALLAHAGYKVVASTGRTEAHAYLTSLGAHAILDRQVLAAPANRPLDSERWGGALDTVGGQTLAGLLRGMAYRTGVAACGVVGGSELTTTVFPFILRGVRLLGIDSGQSPHAERVAAWNRLAKEMPLQLLDQILQIIPLRDVPRFSQEILQGRVRGRLVVDVNAT